MKKRPASALVYIIFFFVVIFAFAAFAVDATIVFTARAKLQNATEVAAMAGASDFVDGDATSMTAVANRAFSVFKADDLEYATTTVNVNSNKVRVTTSCLCQPYFLAFLGVSGIRINAVAVAVSETLPITPSYGGINWVTANTAYRSDILFDPNASDNAIPNNFRNTAILHPLGNFVSSSIVNSTDATTNEAVKLGYLTKGDNIPLSLGPGGYVTMRLPSPIVDKPGADLFIKEFGDALEGYFVYAGLDVDPENPYVDYNNTGAGIRWKNISCSGTPEVKDDSGIIGAYSVAIASLGTPEEKFYGSGYFDIGASCADLSMAKYIRIIDDNHESAFVNDSIRATSSTKYYKSILSGESSTITAGADIDYVEVKNHVRLMPPSSW